MDIRDFGTALVRTGDLDPVYVALHGAKLDPDQLYRTLLAYWCFYHLGLAAWIGERRGEGYWACMHVAAENATPPSHWGRPGERWPRATERRHFRGQKCVDSVAWIRDEYGSPEGAVHRLTRVNEMTETAVMAEVMKWPLFGPWIAFKAADMLERVAGVPIKFSRNIGLMYESPRAGLERLTQDATFITSGSREPAALYEGLLTYFSTQRAPPGRDRFCGPQEVETILCKWDSHMKGGYAVGKDIAEVRHALHGWGPAADRMLGACPDA